MDIHELDEGEVFRRLGTLDSGLTVAEAEARLDKYGPNRIQEIKRKPLILLFAENLYNVLAVLLWIAGALSFLIGSYQLGAAIISVILINAIFSFWQEYEAEKATEALKRILL